MATRLWNADRPRAQRQTTAPLLAVGVAAAVWACESIIWSGQPGAGADGADVLAYYGGRAARVMSGDVVWLVACLALTVLAHRTAARLITPMRRVLVAAVGAVAGLATTSAVIAVVLALLSAGGGLAAGDALRLWEAEGSAFGLATKLFALALVLGAGIAAVDPAPLTRPVGLGLAAIGSLLAVVLWFDLLGGAGFAIAPLWLGLVALAPTARPALMPRVAA